MPDLDEAAAVALVAELAPGLVAPVAGLNAGAPSRPGALSGVGVKMEP